MQQDHDPKHCQHNGFHCRHKVPVNIEGKPHLKKPKKSILFLLTGPKKKDKISIVMQEDNIQ